MMVEDQQQSTLYFFIFVYFDTLVMCLHGFDCRRSALQLCAYGTGRRESLGYKTVFVLGIFV